MATTRHEDEIELVPKGGTTVAEGGTDAAIDNDGDAQKMDSALQSTSSTYWSLLIFALIWWVGIFFFYLNGVSQKKNDSCLASSKIITVLQYVPYKLHSQDLQSAIFTINKQYNVDAKFFDKHYVDTSANAVAASQRVPPVGDITLAACTTTPPPSNTCSGGALANVPATASTSNGLHAFNTSTAACASAAVCVMGQDPYNFLREFNIQTLFQPYPNTIAGSTNWMEYYITFNSLDSISADCLAPMNTFVFKNADGTIQY